MQPPPADPGPARRTAAESAGLHAFGRRAHWGNLGLWQAGTPDYADAAEALARAVGEAAGLGPGQRVLELGCGGGDGLCLWLDGFGVAQVRGVERDGPLADQARRQALARGAEAGRSWQVVTGDALDPGALGAGHDAVVCVDAAYHVSPRPRGLAAVHGALRPGGRLAYTDLVLDRAGAPPRALAAAARACGVAPADLVDLQTQADWLRATGFVDLQARRLDAEVLGGFARFVARQTRRLGLATLGPGWRRPLLTGLMIPPARAAGLGYVLWSARRPG